MTVYLVPIHTNRYIGASSDNKPTGVPVGSTFFETDTGSMYICSDGSTWVVFNNTNVSGE